METKSILDKQISPLVQLGVILSLCIVLMAISGLIPRSPYSTTGPIMPWVVLCGMILFFALVNSILSFAAIDGQKYWLQSIISFALLLIFGGLLAWAFSGVSINDAGSVRWL
ncbi:MAG: hypothetical protein WBO36_16910, partial [Saprospiraceae bacterium]